MSNLTKDGYENGENSQGQKDIKKDLAFISTEITIPQELIDKWQNILDNLVDSFGFSYTAIMEVAKDHFHVLLTSHNPENPFVNGTKYSFGSGMYCETIIKTNQPLYIPKETARPGETEDQNDEDAYYGMPIHFDNGSCFGTLCIFDSGKKLEKESNRQLIGILASSIDNDLQLLFARQSDVLKAENEIKANNSLSKFVPGGIFSYSAEKDEQFSFISDNMLAFLGFTQEEFRNAFQNRFSNMVFWEDRNRVLSEINQQISRTPFDTVEYRIKKKDGDIVWVHDEGHIITDENGKRWFYVVIVDITDSINTKQKLILENQQLELIIQDLQRTVDKIPGGIRIFQKKNGKIICLNANQYYADMLGVNKNDLIGESFNDVELRIHPDDLKRHREETVTNLDKNHHSEGTYRFFIPKAGRYKWFHIEAILSAQADGNNLAYFHYSDVDELKRAEEEELNRQKQYELAVKGAHLAVWEYDISTQKMTVPEGENSAFAKERYGFKSNIVENVPECMLPMGVTESDRKKFLQMYDEIRSGHEYTTADIWFRKSPQDEPRCDRISYYTVKDSNGIPVRAYGVGIDITASMQEQLQFRHSIQAILSANPDALCTFQIDLTKNICYEGHGASEFVLNSLQSDTAEGLFDNAVKIIPNQEDKHIFSSVINRKQLLTDFESEKINQHVDYRRSDKDGKSFWVRTFVKLLKNPESGDIEGVIYSIDISREIQQKEIMRILTGEEYDLIALLNLDTETIEAIHLSDSLPQEYQSSFSATGDICSFSDMRKNGADSWVAAEERNNYLEGTSPEKIRQMLDKYGQYELTIRGNQKGKGPIYRKLKHYYLNEQKKSVLIIDSDVTQMYLQQQKELETEKALRLQATAANEAKSAFLSRMSHDIRTPLNGIIGMSYIAQKEKNPPQTADCLNKIDISSKFLLNLINDILDMSKAESKKIVLHPEPYPYEEFYEYINAVIKPLCAEKNQIFKMEANPPADVIPAFDKLHINQIIFNLLSNSVKYTPEGGTISYSAHFGKINEGMKIPVEIKVSDTGIGMSEEFQKKLFEPFAQEERSDSEKVRGTGLGLAIVKQMVDLMGGTISAQSKIGTGTTFSIHMVVDCVPREKASAEEHKNDGSGDTDILTGKHLLLCEDHPLNQEIARTILMEKGLIVEVAENGQRGIDYFSRSLVGFYDVILMDIHMPVMGGYEATEKIRKLPRKDAKTVPIIAMTADAFDDDIKKCLDAGMNGHIAKPINPEELFRMLTDILGSH